VATLRFDYHFAVPASAEHVRLHIPPGLTGITSVRINGSTRALSLGETVLQVS
jgi:hypothetical protein